VFPRSSPIGAVLLAGEPGEACDAPGCDAEV
jgi:hypothetical protein